MTTLPSIQARFSKLFEELQKQEIDFQLGTTELKCEYGMEEKKTIYIK